MSRPALRVDARESARAALGALLAVTLTGVIAQWAGAHWEARAWMVAPIGASAVLLFAVPASPLARPWSVIAGNTLSALIGIGFVRIIPDANVAAGLAVGTAIGAMVLLRCLHPPGGATALLVALGGVTDPLFALFPVLVDSTLLVAIALILRRVSPPTPALPAPVPPTVLPEPTLRISDADLDAALERHNRALDVERDDLDAVLREAQANAYARTMGALTCRDAMTPNPRSVEPGTPLQAAWRLMHAHSIKALPVVDTQARIVGIVTLSDFVRRTMDRMTSEGSAAPPQASFTPTGGELGAARPWGRSENPIRPEPVIADIMSRRVRVAGESLSLVELLPLFSEGGHHHLPVVDAGSRLVGMITQSDVFRALHPPPS